MPVKTLIVRPTDGLSQLFDGLLLAGSIIVGEDEIVLISFRYLRQGQAAA
jgi:hypothetical protein